MIVSGTVTSAPVQGVSVQDPADTSPPTGAGVAGFNGKWVLSTSETFVLSNLGTLATGTTILDWTQAGYFTFTAYGGSFTLSFTNAAGVFTPSLGQIIKIRITGAGSAAATWPSTITWVGVLASTGGTSASAPVLTANVTDVTLICTATGSAPTFDGTYITS
jgi:hypothetical protein